MKDLILIGFNWVDNSTSISRTKSYFAEFVDSEGEIYKLDLLPIIRSITSREVTEIMREQIEKSLEGKTFAFMDIGVILDVKREVFRALF